MAITTGRLLKTWASCLGLFLVVSTARSIASPQQTIHSPEDAKHTIVALVSSGNTQLTVRDIPKFITDDEQLRETAEGALRDLLRVEQPDGGSWRNAVDALGVLGGYSHESGEQTLKTLEQFSLNARCYGCTERDGDLPNAPLISDAAIGAKSEVPHAIVNFARAARIAGNLELKREAAFTLQRASVASFWNDLKWATRRISHDSVPTLQERLASNARTELSILQAH
jgi:hypothetical protein